MGEVWRAEAADGTPVAIKVARPDIVGDPRRLKQIEGEIRAMARLDHPAVVWVYDHGQVPADSGLPLPAGAPYLVLEHCGGGTLRDRPPETWAALRALIESLLDALAAVHARGIVHRDLKPANILWPGPKDVRAGPKLADFGIAHAVGVAVHDPLGTPSYMAPEQAASGPIGPWSDLYALGVVLWEVCTGRLPYRSTHLLGLLAAVQRGRLPRFAPRFEVPSGLGSWLARLLDRDPARRFGRAADALRALAAIDPEVAGPPTVGRRWTGPRLRLQGAGLKLLPLRELEIVGRTDERERLWGALQRTIEGGAVEVALVRGVSGIGKTRLLDWLAQRAAELGVADVAAVDVAHSQALQDLVGRVAAPSDLPELRLPEALPAEVGPRWVVPAVRRVLRTLAARRPLLLVFDDVHRSESAVQLARALLAERDTHPVPLLVVMAAEEEALAEQPEAALLGGLDGCSVLDLGPLSASEQEELLQALVGLAPEDHSALLVGAAGHPGHLVARVLGLARDGVLVPGPRGFCRSQSGGDLLPPSLPALWERRLAGLAAELDDGALAMLERAAILGPAVDEAAWEAVAAPPERAIERLRLLDRLISSGLARDTGRGFAFTHPALLDALIRQSRAAGRYESHHRAAAAYVARLPQPAHALRLGGHLAEAGEPLAAVDALLEGIEHAWSHGDRRPLLAEIDRAEACADRAGLPADDLRRGRLLQRRALSLVSLGRANEAVAAAERAHTIAVRAQDRRTVCQCTMRLADAHAVGGAWSQAEVWLHRFLEVEDAAPHPHWGGIVRARLGRSRKEEGNIEEAQRWFDEAERLLGCCPDPRSPAVLTARVELASWRDDMVRMLSVATEAEQVAAEAGLLPEQAFAACKVLEATLALGRLGEARESGERALATARISGDRRGATFIRAQLANVALMADDPRTALRWVDEALAGAGLSDHPWLETLIWALDCDSRLRLGDLEGFDRAIDRVAALAPRLPEPDPRILEGLEEWAAAFSASGDRARAEAIEQVKALFARSAL